MNKYLLLSAAAVMAGTAGAQAGTPVHSWTFASSGGTPYCDGGTLYTNGSSIWAWQHTNNNCASGVSNGTGRNGKQGAFGKGADMSDNLYAVNYGYSSIAINFLLPAKFSGKKANWALDVEFSGTTAFQGNSGILVNVTPGHKNGSHKSTVTALKTLIAAHKAAKHHA